MGIQQRNTKQDNSEPKVNLEQWEEVFLELEIGMDFKTI